LRECLLADDELARVLEPVLREYGLERVDDGAAHADAEVPNALQLVRVAEPGIDDTVAADEARAAVDDDELAMVAVVVNADVLPARRMMKPEVAAGLLEPLLRLGAHVLAAAAVDEHAHRDA